MLFGCFERKCLFMSLGFPSSRTFAQPGSGHLISFRRCADLCIESTISQRHTTMSSMDHELKASYLTYTVRYMLSDTIEKLGITWSGAFHVHAFVLIAHRSLPPSPVFAESSTWWIRLLMGLDLRHVVSSALCMSHCRRLIRK